MKYLLDTNICIYIINNKPEEVRKQLRQHAIGDIGISSITLAELRYGCDNSSKVEQNHRALDRFSIPLEVLSFDAGVARHYGKIRAQLKQQGQLIGSMDLQIAAHALSLKAALVTNNTKEFERVADLKLVNWLE